MSRHMHGSVLPSEGHDTFAPVACAEAVVRVVRSDELQTYFLVTDGLSILGEHANGHTMKAMADRMGAGNVERAKAQWQYVQDCGGTAKPWPAFLYYMGATP